MTTHKLKTHPIPFKATEQGLKPFEYRRNDRNFQAGDNLLLQEFDPNHNEYTGKEILVEVQYVLYGGEYGIPNDYCIMSIQTTNQAFVISYTTVNYSGNDQIDPSTQIEAYGLEDIAMRRFEEIIIEIANDTGFDIQDYLDLLAEEDEKTMQKLEEGFDGIVIIEPTEIYVRESFPEREYHLKLERVEIKQIAAETNLSQELKNMAAFNYGWIQALLSSFRDDSWDELKERAEIKNLLANDDNNDDVIDIEVGDAAFGSIATSIRISDDGWRIDECFDIYDKDNNLVAENMTFPFER